MAVSLHSWTLALSQQQDTKKFASSLESQVSAKDFKPDEDTGMLTRRCTAWFTGTFCVSRWKPPAFNSSCRLHRPFLDSMAAEKTVGLCGKLPVGYWDIKIGPFRSCLQGNGLTPFRSRKDFQLPMSSAWPNLWGRCTHLVDVSRQWFF